MNKVKKSDVVEGLRTCAKMRNAWYNGKSPNDSYDCFVGQIEKVLKELLKGAKVEVEDDK